VIASCAERLPVFWNVFRLQSDRPAKCLPLTLLRPISAGFLAFAAVLPCWSPAAAQTPALPDIWTDGIPEIAPDASTFTLDNGLVVVVIPDHRAPVVTHSVYYRVGAADERPGHTGLAHFLEHLML